MNAIYRILADFECFKFVCFVVGSIAVSLGHLLMYLNNRAKHRKKE